MYLKIIIINNCDILERNLPPKAIPWLMSSYAHVKHKLLGDYWPLWRNIKYSDPKYFLEEKILLSFSHVFDLLKSMEQDSLGVTDYRKYLFDNIGTLSKKQDLKCLHQGEVSRKSPINSGFTLAYVKKTLCPKYSKLILDVLLETVRTGEYFEDSIKLVLNFMISEAILNSYDACIDRLLMDPNFSKPNIHLFLAITNNKLFIIITDNGAGENASNTEDKKSIGEKLSFLYCGDAGQGELQSENYAKFFLPEGIKMRKHLDRSDTGSQFVLMLDFNKIVE